MSGPVSDYKPGSFFLTTITGPAGYAIGLGQALAGAPSRYQHAGIILDGDGTILEAEPGGARIANISEYQGRGVLVCDGPVQQWIQRAASTGDPSAELAWIRDRIVREARKLVGVPYSPLDYLALALLHLHLPSGWVRHRVQRSGHLICSQLVDAVYQRAGIQLYDDGRLPGDVMPADLAAWAEDRAQVAA